MYAEKAHKMGDIGPETSCQFVREANEGDEDLGLVGIESGPALGVEEEVATELIKTTSSNDVLTLWPWVNQVC